MPSTPELGDVRGAVRHFEILRELEAQHASDADGHIGVSGEITVNLHGVSQEPLKQRESIVSPRVGEDQVDVTRDLIRENGFLNGPDQELNEAALDILSRRSRSELELRKEL